MAQRVFGPVLGAGVQITEEDGQRPIDSGQLGIVGHAGMYEKGDPGKMIGPLTNKRSFRKTMGGLIPDSLAPDAAVDFFDVANGAGGVLFVRVTDGNEREAGGYAQFDNATDTVNLLSRRDLRTEFGKIQAKNGGLWGGTEKRYTNDVAVVATDIAETAIDIGGTEAAKFTEDEWVGGFIELNAVPNVRYKIVSSQDPSGTVTEIEVESDQTMASDLAASADPADARYYLVRDDVPEKRLEYEIRDGNENPTTEFGLFIFENGAQVLNYPDLSIDTSSGRYWVDLINDDGNNESIFVTDTFSGTRTADVRPANHYGLSATLTATTLVRELSDFIINDITASLGDPTFALGTTDDVMLEQVITVTMTAATTGTAVSDRFGPLGTVTFGTLFDPPAAVGGALANKYAPPFTVTAGGTPLAATDELIINYKPFKPDELIGGFLFPDKPNDRLARFRIVDNDHDSITVAAGSDMTTVAVATDEFQVEAPRHLQNGRSGNVGVADAEYQLQAWDTGLSPFNQTANKNFGLVKFATPGVTATAVQKDGIAYAAAKNYQYRVEVTPATVTESAADTYVNDTIGRSDYAVVAFPSYGYKTDPDGEQGKLKLVSLSGAIHGRESATARDNFGYHKAAAGVAATLPGILKLTTGDEILNEELLNPRGINVIKKLSGNFVIWGDRTLWVDPQWKFKHERETFSYYEHVLQEAPALQAVIFGLNNGDTRAAVITSLISFFLPEYQKQALDNDFAFLDAVQIKSDLENNTPATKAAGDLIVEITLRLTGVVERLRISISKSGIFEATV